MIKTIKELQIYQHELRDKLLKSLGEKDGFYKLLMTSPGCPPSKIAELKKALPGIPSSYTEWVERLNLNGISVGYFGVCPSAYNEEGMVANIIAGNEEGVMCWEYAKKYHLYAIATSSEITMYVATASSPFKEGEIISIDSDIYTTEDEAEEKKYILPAAKDFEEFLLIAGNLNQINREFKEDSERREELAKRLKALNVSEEYHDAWLNNLMY